MANIRRHEGGEQMRGRDPFEVMRGLMGWDPWENLRGLSTERGGVFVPDFEVKETKNAWVFRADLPGVREEDVDISLTGNRLTISGKRDEERKEEGERYFTYERTYGSFSRSFTLPEDVDGEHVDAELKDGVLTLTMAKRPELQPKKISLKGALNKVKGSFETKAKA